MPVGFLNIPEWTFWENAGAGLAVADLDGDGGRDLLVLTIDNPPGQNAGFYRVGKSLDATDTVADWGPWLEIPDWNSWENDGGGLAVADVDGDGQLDLVVFMIDSPPAQNAGFYRLGKKLDGNGNVTGGWGPWIAIPDWFMWENQHGGIAVRDVNGDGELDLVVFAVDNGPQQNRGVFRIGKSLDANGNVTGGWTDWQDVPGWFSWDNQGAGVAVADLEGSGLIDLIVFQVDNALQQNQAFYKIGRNLRPDGTVAGGWTSWLGIPGWEAWENQGAAIALTENGGKHELAVMMVDNPPGQNAGFYQVLGLDPDPVTQGEWEVMSFHSGVLAVHLALVPKGKVLFFAGSGSSLVRFDSPDLGDVAKGIFSSALWDPAAPVGANFVHPPSLFLPNGKLFDFFCGGDAFLADGRMLQGGGTFDYPRPAHGFFGIANCAAFDWKTEKWTFVETMAGARWYPTLITLADGRVLAASGLDVHGGLNATLEVYDPATDDWEMLHAPGGGFPGLPLYAHLFVLANGKVLFTGGRMDDPNPVGPCTLDLTQNPVAVAAHGGLADPASRNQSASVMLPPAQEQRVMIIGGGPADETDATDSVDIIDMTQAVPAFQPAAPLNLPRMHLNAVLLPDHTVFVSGGSLIREGEDVSRVQAEIFDPATNQWTIVATATVPRLYHSTAVLMADGRVVAAGGNPEGGAQVAWEPPDPDEEMRIEVYRPPYLFRGPRPVITAAPEECAYGETITIKSAAAGDLRWVSIIHPGVTTHSFNSSQRLVDLDIVSQAAGEIKATFTGNANLAPPGWYMLFLVNNDGVPSVAHWIHLT